MFNNGCEHCMGEHVVGPFLLFGWHTHYTLYTCFLWFLPGCTKSLHIIIYALQCFTGSFNSYIIAWGLFLSATQSFMPMHLLLPSVLCRPHNCLQTPAMDNHEILRIQVCISYQCHVPYLNNAMTCSSKVLCNYNNIASMYVFSMQINIDEF